METVVGEIPDNKFGKWLYDSVVMAAQLTKPPKMSLEELIEAARGIDSEINMFEARWVDKVDKLTYKDVVNLIFAEIDRYPTIKKYNDGKQEDLKYDLMEGLCEAMGVDFKANTNWLYVKEMLVMNLTPNRWV